MSDKLQELGIPQHEITPSVSIAVNGLLDHVGHLNKSLNELREQYSNLQSMVDIDAGAAIPNRKAFVKRLDWAIAMSKRYAGATSVVTFAINDFDSIIRTYGYEAASHASSHVANFIAGHSRDTDFFARLNESQFGILMYFAEIIDAKAKAEKLSNELRNMPFRWNSGIININLSYGVHGMTTSDDGESALLSSLNTLFVNDTKTKFEQINFKA